MPLQKRQAAKACLSLVKHWRAIEIAESNLRSVSVRRLEGSLHFRKAGFDCAGRESSLLFGIPCKSTLVEKHITMTEETVIPYATRA